MKASCIELDIDKKADLDLELERLASNRRVLCLGDVLLLQCHEIT